MTRKSMAEYHKLTTQLRENLKKQKGLGEIQKRISHDVVELMREENVLKQQIIREAKMLSVSLFELKLYGGPEQKYVFLVGLEKDFEELSDLISDNAWGTNFEMPNDVMIYINEGKVKVSFEHNPDIIEEFINDHGIRVDIDSFLREKKGLESKLRQVDSIVSKFKRHSKRGH